MRYRFTYRGPPKKGCPMLSYELSLAGPGAYSGTFHALEKSAQLGKTWFFGFQKLIRLHLKFCGLAIRKLYIQCI
jgi:hypothetical protein